MTAAVKELPVRPVSAEETDPKEIVAVVLADGSVRDLRGSQGSNGDGRPHASGALAGPDWILWWERRSFR